MKLEEGKEYFIDGKGWFLFKGWITVKGVKKASFARMVKEQEFIPEDEISEKINEEFGAIDSRY
jgi:hypothetical protein